MAEAKGNENQGKSVRTEIRMTYTVNLNKFRVLKTFDVTDYIIQFEYIYYYF